MILLEIIENTPGVAKAEEGISKRSLSKALGSREGKVIWMLAAAPWWSWVWHWVEAPREEGVASWREVVLKGNWSDNLPCKKLWVGWIGYGGHYGERKKLSLPFSLYKGMGFMLVRALSGEHRARRLQSSASQIWLQEGWKLSIKYKDIRGCVGGAEVKGLEVKRPCLSASVMM